jgi:hypothetical protein
VHIHNDAPVSDQGCHMSNWTEGTALTKKLHIVSVACIYSLLLAHGKILINLVLLWGMNCGLWRQSFQQCKCSQIVFMCGGIHDLAHIARGSLWPYLDNQVAQIA